MQPGHPVEPGPIDVSQLGRGCPIGQHRALTVGTDDDDHRTGATDSLGPHVDTSRREVGNESGTEPVIADPADEAHRCAGGRGRSRHVRRTPAPPALDRRGRVGADGRGLIDAHHDVFEQITDHCEHSDTVGQTGVMPFDDVLTDPAQLAEHYRQPSRLVRDKAIDHLDGGAIDFIVRSTFVLAATSASSGELDVSPRGGPAGFVKVLDADRLAIPDLNGNNRLDSLHNVIETGQIGLLFVVPGLGETLRVNGTAAVTCDRDVLDLFADDVRRPATAIGVTVREAYIHCAKSFRRGGIWQPDTWPAADQRPSPGAVIIGHVGLSGVTAEQVETSLEQSYRDDLAAERPDAASAV